MAPVVHTFRGSSRGSSAGAVAVPSGFGWTPTFSISRRGPGMFACALHPSTLAPATTATFYADSTKANNGGNGTSPALAEQAIWAALNDVGAGVHATIYVLGSADPLNPTVYGYAKAWRVGTSADLRVLVVSDFTTLAPGYAISSMALVAGDGELGTWALTADPDGPAVYEATLATAPDRVIDATVPDADGIPTKLTIRASVALVQANPGSYYHAGGKLYVRTFDSRAPSFPSLRPLRGGTSVNGLVNGTRTAYVERLSFEGGGPARVFYAQDGNVALVDCDVTHGQSLGFELNTSAGLTNATRTAHLFRCRFVGNGGDGCGYTALGSGMTVRALEVDCLYARNSGAGSDQGGSAHFTAGNAEVSVIRVNPRSTANKSQGFADVGGCDVWMLGPRVTAEVSGVYCGDAGATWLHEPNLGGNTTDLVTDNAAGVIYVAGGHYATTSGAGTEGTVYSP